MLATSRLTRKYQATIPREVRRALDIRRGDAVLFDVRDDGTVLLRRAEPLDLAFAKALTHTLSEWDSVRDDEDFRDL